MRHEEKRALPLQNPFDLGRTVSVFRNSAGIRFRSGRACCP